MLKIQKKLLLIAAMTLMVMAGCANMDNSQGQADALGYNMINTNLPTKKLAITSGTDRHELNIEFANTDQTRKIGLMNRSGMDQDKGMLFAFDTQGYVYFWMRNTLFPLDMIFIDQDGIIRHIAHDAQPCAPGNDNDCPKISSERPVKYVLEVNAGIADKFKLKDGDYVSWN